ncbi:MAG: HEAT repeat domain-containing protein [Candidatus ainarchaeum sp.]|nr:HEAT repeat domain-containing protein [Candidatus ainarchaeum sp.]
MGDPEILRSALEQEDFSRLVQVLKRANDSEEDLSELVKPEREGVLKLLGKGLAQTGSRDAAVIYLSKISARDDAFFLLVCKLLESGSVDLSSGAAEVISGVCSRRADACTTVPDWVPGRLVSLLEAEPARAGAWDRAREARAHAAEALGSLKFDGAIPALVAALGDPDLQVSAAASYALASMGDSGKVIEAMSRIASSKTPSPHSVTGALWVIGRIAQAVPEGPQQASLRGLTPVLLDMITESDDTEVQQLAANAMLQIDRVQAVSKISSLLKKDFGERRERVLRAVIAILARLSAAGYSCASDALRGFVARMASVPEASRPAAYDEAKFALEVMDVEGRP